MKKITAILLLAAMFLSMLPALAVNAAETVSAAGTYVEYVDSGKVFAAQIGDVYGAVATDLFGAREVQEFTFAPDMLEAVRMGKVDAAILDDAYTKQIEDSGEYPDLAYLPVPAEVFVNMAANVFLSEELRDRFNEWFESLLRNGTFDEIFNRWIGVSLPDEEDIPRFELTGENGTLRVCNTGSFPPFSYSDSKGEPVGFDEEIVRRFAQHLGMDVEYSAMSYDAIIPYVLSGKADMSGCSFSVTGERSESVLFGAPYMKAKAMLVVPKSGADSAPPAARDHTFFEGKDVAVMTGVLTVNTTELIGGNPIEYNDSASAAEDVRNGRVAGYMHALTAVQVMASQMEGFEVIPVPKEIFSAQVAGISQNQDVIDRFNTFLAAVQADGTLAEMSGRWFGPELDLDAPIPDIPNTGENGIIKVAICSDSIPYVFVGNNGEYSGFSTELALRFGAFEGKTIEFTDMEFGGLIPYIVSEKADIGLANMAITEERRQSVLFTDPYFDEGHGVLVLKETDAGGSVYTDFFGKTIGIPTGYVLDGLIENEFGGTVAYYTDPAAGIEDVRRGRVDGFMTDLSSARVIVNEPGNEALMAVPVPDSLFSGPLGAITANQEIADRFSAFLAELGADGTLADIQYYWLEDNPGSDPPMPDIPLTGENGVLTAAVGASSIPFTYVGADGEMKGLCLELLYRFAAREGLTLELVSMEFGALIPYISSGKADIGIDAITITEERKKSVIFTEPFYFDQIGIIALRPAEGEADGGGFIEWLKTGVERNLLTDNRWRMIVDGLGVTMIISLAAQLLGTVFGCLVCWLLMRKNAVARNAAKLYCGLIHGTPMVVLLMITYYIIFGNTELSNVLIAIAAFTMITAPAVAETLKGAIDTVDPVEIEAARSIGFSAFRAFMTVTLPQAVRRALPGYTNSFIELVKATAIVGYIAIQDLTRAGDIIRSRTYDAYFPLLFVAVIYLIVTALCVQVFKRIVKKINGETAGIRPRGKLSLQPAVLRMNPFAARGGDLLEQKGDGEQ